ncbi:MAG: DUF4369 domain-containing protein [Prevotella sp.]|uniref:DUF4369 domain-containing protein n=1 Tax=Prevotella sp. P5-92 TaxID=2024222 RepID=UPI000B9678E1|nr:DUF4369 domain-containing protein [Prevotella sp. P5-92]MDD6820263.1 DUF4369 domain-containing protein [Prevotella sp.]MDY4653797.1 DUF4369 domain-containing protein [Prevotella sp.]OYP56806.1 hypothetical protein CIK99_08810 [Prevotella sp. P5-92]
MKKITYALAMAVSVFASCTGSYNVQGSSSVSALDGSKLYLKAIKNNELKNIDSCDVVHGQFNFNGTLDTVRMVNLFMDDQSIMPMVLEEGEITIKIDNASQKVSGTPLNEKLYDFLDKHNRLDNQMNELAHKQSQMMLDGIDEDEINQKLSIEAAQIAKEEDKLVTSFIVDNFDNVLGPGVFMMITSGYQYPILTPQIEDIMSKATDKFKSNPYVSEYYKIASENEARMQGLEPDGTPTPTQAQPQETIDSISAGQQVNNSPFSQKVLTDSIKK